MKLTIELPFPLPTWNRILGMNRWERMRLRKCIHLLTSISIADDTGSQTPKDAAQRRLLMDSLKRDYFRMIRPGTSKMSRTRRKKSRLKNLNPQ